MHTSHYQLIETHSKNALWRRKRNRPFRTGDSAKRLEYIQSKTCGMDQFNMLKYKSSNRSKLLMTYIRAYTSKLLMTYIRAYLSDFLNLGNKSK